MSFVDADPAGTVKAFATAPAIGLLVGVERECRPDSAAGPRTFARVSMPGSLGHDRGRLVRMAAIVILIVHSMVMIRPGDVSPKLVARIAVVFACGLVPAQLGGMPVRLLLV